jgi:uncharacterized protein
MLRAMTGSEPQPPQLQFPCDYPIKVIAHQGTLARHAVDSIIARHAGAGALTTATERASSQANFVSITYTIRPDSAEKIALLFKDLKQLPGVVMVL